MSLTETNFTWIMGGWSSQAMVTATHLEDRQLQNQTQEKRIGDLTLVFSPSILWMTQLTHISLNGVKRNRRSTSKGSFGVTAWTRVTAWTCMCELPRCTVHWTRISIHWILDFKQLLLLLLLLLSMQQDTFDRQQVTVCDTRLKVHVRISTNVRLNGVKRTH